MRILLVEDEPAIVRALVRGLQAHGYEVLTADNGADAVALACDESVEFVLLDISLPVLDGHEVLRRIRVHRRELPVLMLTAADDVRHKVRALDAGADDYMTKPFAFDELLARIRVRARQRSEPMPVVLHAGDVRLDLLSRLAWTGGQPVELSSREFALLEYFVRHPGRLLSRQAILEGVWRLDFDPGSNIVDVYVGYVRRKIDRPGSRSSITAVRGAGYRFDPPGSARY